MDVPRMIAPVAGTHSRMGAFVCYAGPMNIFEWFHNWRMCYVKHWYSHC